MSATPGAGAGLPSMPGSSTCTSTRRGPRGRGERGVVIAARAKGIALAVALQLGLFGVSRGHAQAEQYIPAQPTGYLTDAAGVVDATNAARIEQVAKTLRERTGAEMAIVTLPTI